MSVTAPPISLDTSKTPIEISLVGLGSDLDHHKPVISCPVDDLMIEKSSTQRNMLPHPWRLTIPGAIIVDLQWGTHVLIAMWITKDKDKYGTYFTHRVIKMALWGLLVGAPVRKLINNILDWVVTDWFFGGQMDMRSGLMRILASSLIVSTLTVSSFKLTQATNLNYRRVVD
jgi:hypothetical protein